MYQVKWRTCWVRPAITASECVEFLLFSSSCSQQENFMCDCILISCLKNAAGLQILFVPYCLRRFLFPVCTALIVVWAARRKLHHCPTSNCSLRTGRSVHWRLPHLTAAVHWQQEGHTKVSPDSPGIKVTVQLNINVSHPLLLLRI